MSTFAEQFFSSFGTWLGAGAALMVIFIFMSGIVSITGIGKGFKKPPVGPEA